MRNIIRLMGIVGAILLLYGCAKNPVAPAVEQAINNTYTYITNNYKVTVTTNNYVISTNYITIDRVVLDTYLQVNLDPVNQVSVTNMNLLRPGAVIVYAFNNAPDTPRQYLYIAGQAVCAPMFVADFTAGLTSMPPYVHFGYAGPVTNSYQLSYPETIIITNYKVSLKP